MFKEILITVGTQFLVGVCGFATSILLARTLGSTGMGEYSLVMTTLGLLLLCGNLGLGAANIYLAGRNRTSIAGLIVNSCVVSLISGLVMIGGFWMVGPWVFTNLLREVDPLYLWIGLAAIPFFLGRVLFQSILRGMQRILAWNVVVLTNSILLLCLMALVVGVGSGGVLGAMIVQTLVAVMVSGGLLIGLVRSVRVRWAIQPNTLKQSLLYGVRVQTSNVINFFNYRLNFYLLAVFLSVREVGHYAVAFALIQPVMLIPTATQYVLFPRISSADEEEATKLMPRLIRIMVLLMLGIVLVGILLSRPLILGFYGAEYSAAVIPLRILLLSCVISGVNSALSAYNSGRGKPEIAVYASVVGLGLTVLFGFLLVPRYGLMGAAMASTIAYSGLGLVELVGYLWLSGNGVLESLIFRKDDLHFVWSEFVGVWTATGTSSSPSDSETQGPTG